MGDHPAVLAISVANEIPNDIVRFYGDRRIQTFLDELLDTVHQSAPACLATYANYPTTEFLQPTQQDFCCFNIYLHDSHRLGRYLDRLQHLAGGMPLVVGEYGVDSHRHGMADQATCLAEFANASFRHGVAGAFVFGFTDDWFTGGHRIEDWAFGVTTVARHEKPAARRLTHAWKDAPTDSGTDWPMVSVVVCSYQGAATLGECLNSLMRLNYPDYEVILVDDGSTDDTAAIAGQFPQVRYLRQPNQGLSVARNVGMRSARGQVVAYTDSDCSADEDWLLYLVDGLRDQGVEGIGGPNLTPPADNVTAQCVAASPGNPSHVMFDDQLAEHLPGCNFAFLREALVEVGGFDPQFRQAGDDVDLCWRLLDRGRRLGYAGSAMVWHHRRRTVRAYYQQQKGYGRAEAMLAFKHPQRFLASGLLRFDGVIYGDGKAGLQLLPPKVYHGRFGSAPFQTIYQTRDFRFDARATSLEWHCLAAICLLLAMLWPPLALAGVAMWLLTLRVVFAAAWNAPLAETTPFWGRAMVFWLHLTQPIVRGMHRNGYTLRNKRLPLSPSSQRQLEPKARRISASARELCWPTTNGLGRTELLEALEKRAKIEGWPGDYYGGWSFWDIELMATLWHHVTIHTATEELGWPRRFTRARWQTQPTRVAWTVAGVIAVWSLTALATGATWGAGAGLVGGAALLGAMARSRRRCLTAVEDLIRRTVEECGFLQSSESAGPEQLGGRPVESQAPRRGVRNVTTAAPRATLGVAPVIGPVEMERDHASL
jgi:glycosyltransferase involved in cell wall biosynthesis